MGGKKWEGQSVVQARIVSVFMSTVVLPRLFTTLYSNTMYVCVTSGTCTPHKLHAWGSENRLSASFKSSRYLGKKLVLHYRSRGRLPLVFGVGWIVWPFAL